MHGSKLCTLIFSISKFYLHHRLLPFDSFTIWFNSKASKLRADAKDMRCAIDYAWCEQCATLKMHEHGTPYYKKCMLLTFIAADRDRQWYFLCVFAPSNHSYHWTLQACGLFSGSLSMLSVRFDVCMLVERIDGYFFHSLLRRFSFVSFDTSLVLAVCGSERVCMRLANMRVLFGRSQFDFERPAKRNRTDPLDCLSHTRTTRTFFISLCVCRVYYTFFGNAMHRCNCEHR